MDYNQLCGLNDDGYGEYTAGGITKLCEGLKGSSVTSLRCALGRACSPFCQCPLTLLTTHLRSRARSLSWNELGPKGNGADKFAFSLAEGLKGNSALQSLQYATRARARAREGLLLRLRPLTRLFSLCFHPALSRRLEGNNIGAEGASALAAVLKETKIAELKCAWRRPSVCLLSCQRPLSTS